MELNELQEEVQRLRATVAADEALVARYIRDIERSNAELEQFAYAASHDLQEPLRMISMYVGIIQEELGDQLTAEQKVYLGHVVNGAARMRNLIEALLSYSRVARTATFGMVDLNKALEESIAILNGAVEASNAKIVCDGTLPVAWGDQMMLSRVFLNLITNAMKFRGQEPPVIEIGHQDLGFEWQVWVKDNGIGLDMRYADRIFGIFQRLSPDSSGTGIGLATCKKIVERHGGRIWVESSPGLGATFHFTLRKDTPDE